MKHTLNYILSILIVILTWCLTVPCFADSLWGHISYNGKPWTLNVSRPNKLNNALNERHISLWQSHGRYFDHSMNVWKWQRPLMYGTTEDLFTQTIVVPYLIPMLENAGAVVFTPRERDMQTNEIIVDNDKPASGYTEGILTGLWRPSTTHGFAIPQDSVIQDGYNPFEKGTARVATATHIEDCSRASYQPTFPESGRYAVYISYTTEKNSVDDAHYTVFHKGQKTEFHVNQQMGGGTWVYLGTFEFDKGSSRGNRVVVSSQSAMKGVVTTDAVRFGGGMGNIVRGWKVSGYPRFLEGARYYAQWAGAPRNVYAVYNGDNDYKEDINVRSLMTNWLSGGSPYNPDSTNINPYDTLHVYSDSIIHIQTDTTSRDSVVKVEHIKFRQFDGKKVPFDLSLAIHSDAGFHRDMCSIYGSLTICTTDYNDGMLHAGISRESSKTLARMLLDNARNDLTAIYGSLSTPSTLNPPPSSIKGVWTCRDLLDKNYSETRLPGIPSAIFETLSHQSFPDMRLAHDPDFKFNLARSIYKTLLRYEADVHGVKNAVVQPLPPTHFSIQLTGSGVAVLSWHAQKPSTELVEVDSLEQTAKPTGYNVYCAVDTLGYDNGTHVTGLLHTMQMKQGVLYRFRVTATNDGGESFPTEELCALFKGPNSKTILIVNGFDRLSSPAIVDRAGTKDFDINEDPGLSYGPTACWADLHGKALAGNDFNYVREHAEAISSGRQFNIVSASRRAVEHGRLDLSDFELVDLILGNERNDGHSLRPYKAFTPELQQRLKENSRPILISGSYVASDILSTPEDSTFMTDVLHCSLDSVVRTVNDTVTFLGVKLPIINKLNAGHYATTQSDVISPLTDAYTLMRYSDGSSAAIAIPKKIVLLGFPFECLEDKHQQTTEMQHILRVLLTP